MHNPNPFDFVPFAVNGPLLRTPDEYKTLGSRCSGYLEVKLKALTPAHIVGYQQPDNNNEGQSFIYTQNGRPCIPAATIRGCLRAFIEALTSGWISQANLEYKIDPDFKPQIRTDEKIDIASYLFGLVIEPDNDTQKKHQDLAWKSKVWIEDAFIDKSCIVDKKYWIPDIAGDAFMGGAKPSDSNWWYLQPSEVRQGGQMAEFIGDKFWGRKFYYHQDPQECVAYYTPDSPQFRWEYSDKRPFYRVWLQCLEQNTETDTFRIYFDKVPDQLAMLFVLCLLPGKNIRHKLGYGKAYGYGSIEFTLEKACLRDDDTRSHIPVPLKDLTVMIRDLSEHAWDRALMELNLDETFIDRKALAHLARVLGWQDYNRLLLTYPPFSQGSKGFTQTVTFRQFKAKAPARVSTTAPVKVSPTEAHQIATQLLDIKKPIHFRVYQENAEGWDIIKNRKP